MALVKGTLDSIQRVRKQRSSFVEGRANRQRKTEMKHEGGKDSQILSRTIFPTMGFHEILLQLFY